MSDWLRGVDRVWGCICVLLLLELSGMVDFCTGVQAAQQCEEWVIRVGSAQGSVQARKPGEKQWLPVELNDTYCSGVMIRVGERSRAAVVLPDDSVMRLDENTTISFHIEEKQRTPFLDFLGGAVYLWGRSPRRFQLNTPFVNAVVEGTEFLVRVERGLTFLSVFEGRVAVSNEAGSLTVATGQSVEAQAGQAPILKEVVRPRDAVQWALYYPLVLYMEPSDFADSESRWQRKVRQSIEFYWRNDLLRAFSSLSGVVDDVRDPRLFAYRAMLLLAVGRVEAAKTDLERALDLDPGNAQVFSLQSVMAVAQSDKETALRLAEKAVGLEPGSSAPRIAMSYAKQAHFDIEGALASLKAAVELDPGNALAWARLAEMWLSVGNLDRSLESAEHAVNLNPYLSRTQSVLGFAYLARIETEESKRAFGKAIELDQADPLPRLGLGLALIREGDLEEGRREIELAVSLDPNNSLIRSYLGKAYYDEKREEMAARQFAIAMQLDPMDPTPWFYNAIMEQTLNRPVEALEDFQRSIELNDNRAVYRSRLLLDQDLAARSASLARIYEDLGFEQQAVVEGWKSLNTDPANFSAHRFLADLYSGLPRHEIARVSELLQSQLLQPVNIIPIQPELAESKLYLLSGAGPAEPSFNEFNPLFNRNRLAFLASGIAGEMDTLGEELVLSGVWQRASFSLGQFHYETEGFRPNDDLEQNIYDVFAQYTISPSTSILGEFRNNEFDRGDVLLTFDPSLHNPFLRESSDTGFYRLGLHHGFSPGSDVIAAVNYRTGEFDLELPGLKEIIDETWYGGEIQHIFQTGPLSTVAGFGHSNRELEQSFILDTVMPLVDQDTPNTNAYLYASLHYPETLTWTVGASADFYEGGTFDRDVEQVNPKFGITWTPYSGTTVRAAAFRTFKRPLLLDQTVEPTQVAGFNQFFDDPEATDVWRYGVGLDQKLSDHLYAGAEFSRRDLDVVGIDIHTFEILETSLEELLGRSYVYWTPHPWLALAPEYQFERLDNTEVVPLFGALDVDTHRISLGMALFHPSGLLARLKPGFIIQDGTFQSADVSPEGTPVFEHGRSEFFVLDASIGYRLPNRWGIVELEARNLLDESFRFQDTDPINPRVIPERFIAARFTLAF